MAILRKAKRANYTVIDNAVFMDYGISLKAKGLLCQMLSLPDGWSFSIEGLTRLSPDGKASVMSALNELKDAGYFRRVQLREGNRISGVEYVISETKLKDFQDAENQHAEKQNAGNPPQLNTKELNTKEFIKPTLEEVKQYIEEKKLSVDADYFYEYYEDTGWRDKGGSPVKNWKLKCRTWHKREVDNGNDAGAGNRKRGRVRETTGIRDREPKVSGTKLPPMA